LFRARVAAIYEPPQESTEDRVRLLFPDDKSEVVVEVASGLGLQCVGWIFTDLVPEDKSKGTVRQVRGIHSHFLSAQECITAAHFQNLHPNPCKAAQSGTFGSKFATVIVTGESRSESGSSLSLTHLLF
jgi:nuclear protein localization family protein 4